MRLLITERRQSAILILFGFANILTISAAEPKQLVKPEIARVPDQPSGRLIGVLLEVRVFGPPGYGENPKSDSRRTIFVLKTRQPIKLPDDSTEGTSDVEIFFRDDAGPNSIAGAQKLIRRCVAVSGLVRRSEAGPDYTPIVLELSSIEKTAKSSCEGIVLNVKQVSDLVK